MKKLTLVLVFCAAPALAQITVTPGESPAPVPAQPAQPARQDAEQPPVRRAIPVKSATPAPKATATPEPKKKSGGFFGFFRRLFGGEHAEKPVAKPTATPKGKPTATPKAGATQKAIPAQPKPTATSSSAVTPAPTASPKPSTRKNATPAPIIEGATDLPIPATTNHENAQYQKIKEQALKAPDVTALHEKMLAALTAHPEGGEAYKAAASEYTAALFEKMRKLDPANAEQINRKEGATKRRIDAGLPIVK